ncbi:MAG: hypothetical protein VCB82_08420, partial [Alphaproteobacteria bacterium]
MDKLIPLNVSVRQHQLEQHCKNQREQMNQRHTNQHFDGYVRPTDKGNAFTDDYTKSVYAKIRAADVEMKDNMVQATGSAPYHQRRKI